MSAEVKHSWDRFECRIAPRMPKRRDSIPIEAIRTGFVTWLPREFGHWLIDNQPRLDEATIAFLEGRKN